MSRLPSPPEFTEPFRDSVARAIERVYRETSAEYDPPTGRDSLWFGFTVFCLLGPALRESLKDFGDVTVDREANSYVVTVGPHRLRPNKIGRDASNPIASSFPRKSKISVSMAETNRAQLTLGLTGLDEPVGMELLVDLDVPDPTQWIIGHIGNGEDGLVAAYLCAPWLSDGEAVREWRGWIPIFSQTGGVADAPPPGPPEPDPEPVDIEDLEPELRDGEPQEETGAG